MDLTQTQRLSKSITLHLEVIVSIALMKLTVRLAMQVYAGQYDVSERSLTPGFRCTARSRFEQVFAGAFIMLIIFMSIKFYRNLH